MSIGKGTATVQRDLRTGTPYWLRHGEVRVACSPLAADVAVDVAVVGAGVSGALVADALLRSGKSVAVLDRRGPVRGSTPAAPRYCSSKSTNPSSTWRRRSVASARYGLTGAPPPQWIFCAAGSQTSDCAAAFASARQFTCRAMY